jgi:hypothetical protein
LGVGFVPGAKFIVDAIFGFDINFVQRVAGYDDHLIDVGATDIMADISSFRSAVAVVDYEAAVVFRFSSSAFVLLHSK